MRLESTPENDNEVHGDASLLGREDILGKDIEQYPESQELTPAQEEKLSEALKNLRNDPNFNQLH